MKTSRYTKVPGIKENGITLITQKLPAQEGLNLTVHARCQLCQITDFPVMD